jgi:hypothetical protein
MPKADSDALLDTCFEIVDGRATIQADTFEVKNQQGNRVLYTEGQDTYFNGLINAQGGRFEGDVCVTNGTDNVVAYVGNGSKAFAAGVENYGTTSETARTYIQRNGVSRINDLMASSGGLAVMDDDNNVAISMSAQKLGTSISSIDSTDAMMYGGGTIDAPNSRRYGDNTSELRDVYAGGFINIYGSMFIDYTTDTPNDSQMGIIVGILDMTAQKSYMINSKEFDSAFNGWVEFPKMIFSNIQANHTYKSWVRIWVKNGSVTWDNEVSGSIDKSMHFYYSRPFGALLLGKNGMSSAVSTSKYVIIQDGVLKAPFQSINLGGINGTGLLASGSVTANGAVTAIGPCASVGYNACMNDNLNTFKIKLSGLTHTNYAVQITPRYDASNGNGYLMPSVEQKATDYFTVHLRSTGGVFYYCGFDFVVYGSL